MGERAPFTIRELAERLAQEAVHLQGERFTGQISYTLHCREGGIGRVSVERCHEVNRRESEQVERVTLEVQYPQPPFEAREIGVLVAQEAARLTVDRFTGQLAFTLDCFAGNVWKVSVERRHDLAREDEPMQNRQLRHG